MTSLARSYPRQRGILGGSAETIVNLTAILTIIGIVMGGAYLLVGKSAATAEWQALDTLVTSTKTLYNGELYTTLANSDLITNKLTGNLRVNAANGTITNNFGAAIVAASATCNGVAGACFTITSNSVPTADCISILKQIPVTGYLSVQVGTAAAITAAAGGFPVSVANAEASCNGAGNSNTIVLTAQ